MQSVPVCHLDLHSVCLLMPGMATGDNRSPGRMPLGRPSTATSERRPTDNVNKHCEGPSRTNKALNQGDNSMRSTMFSALALTLVLPLGSSLAAEPTHGTFKTSDGINIHYIEMGKGTPVILIHGYSGSAEGTWLGNGVLEALVKEPSRDRHRLPQPRQERQAHARRSRRGQGRRRADGLLEDSQGPHPRLLDGRRHHAAAADDDSRPHDHGRLRRFRADGNRSRMDRQSRPRQARERSAGGRGAVQAARSQWPGEWHDAERRRKRPPKSHDRPARPRLATATGAAAGAPGGRPHRVRNSI